MARKPNAAVVKFWYVAFRHPNDAPRVYVRNSTTFAMESEAKLFAAER